MVLTLAPITLASSKIDNPAASASVANVCRRWYGPRLLDVLTHAHHAECARHAHRARGLHDAPGRMAVRAVRPDGQARVLVEHLAAFAAGHGRRHARGPSDAIGCFHGLVRSTDGQPPVARSTAS